jgi:membrane dipeptidase
MVDIHLDLAMCAMEWNRDLRSSVSVINDREAGMADKPDRGHATVSLPELRKADVGLVVATQIARYAGPGSSLPGWSSPEQAWAHTQGQRAWYRTMEDQGMMVQLTDRAGLERHLAMLDDAGWRMDASGPPIGFVLSLEGADSLVDLHYLEKAYAYGLRALGPAHYGPGRYANGTNSSGSMGPRGIDLLREMDRLGMILDATHLCDDAFWQAMDLYRGPVWASHSNCRSLVPHNRQFSDEQLRVLIERKAVIGVAMDAWMIVPGWVRGSSTPTGMNCGLEQLADHIDHICGIAGHASQIAIGTDLDGGFGREQCPHDVETIADVHKLSGILARRGYSDEDITGIFRNNALAFLRRNL